MSKMEFEGIWGQYFAITGAIDHAPLIILQAFTGASTIAPVSWQAFGN
jgi:hypothetical protein